MTEAFYKWDKDNVFFLTREGRVEIISYGYPKLEDGSLYYYADQVWLGGDQIPDKFGRNQIDSLFIRLCYRLSIYLLGKEDTFKSLRCEKIAANGTDDEYYRVWLELTNETQSLSLAGMIEYLEQQMKTEARVEDRTMAKIMPEIGLTDSTVFSMILKDWIAYAAWPGARVVFSPPHPDKQGEYSAGTMNVEFTDGNERPEPVVADAIYAVSSIVAAIGNGRITSVELPVEDDEEAKFTITIKKR